MISFLERIARSAGEETMAYFLRRKTFEVYSKSTPSDLVSTADKAVESMICAAIHSRYPEHDIFGEETGRSGSSSEFCWVIDPIDGTQCFVRKHPYFSISIALKQNGKSVAGCVYAPALGLLFSAESGGGAFENGVLISASSCRTLSEASCATGFACLRAGRKENNLKYCNRILPEIRDIKRCGSAALDLCFVASGRYDAYWELCLQEYDVAAGSLIASEAGAKVSDLHGGSNYPASGILAGSPALHAELLPFFAE